MWFKSLLLWDFLFLPAEPKPNTYNGTLSLKISEVNCCQDVQTPAVRSTRSVKFISDFGKFSVRLNSMPQ